MSIGVGYAPMISAPVNSETWAWAKTCLQPPPYVFMRAVHALIQRGKTVGWWPYVDIFHCPAAHDLSPGGLSLKGGPVEINGNFLIEPGLGVTGDGASYVDSLRLLAGLANFTLNNNFELLFLTNDGPTTGSDSGASGGGPIVSSRGRSGNNALHFNCSTSGATLALSPSTATGLVGTLRVDASNVYLIKNKTFQKQSLIAVGLPVSTYRRHRNGLTAGYGTARHGFSLLGGFPSGWSDAAKLAMVADISDACRQFFTTMGTLAQIDIPPAPPFTGPYPFAKTSLASSDDPSQRVFFVTNPPATDSVTNATFPHFPLTDAVGSAWGTAFAASTATGIRRWCKYWENRATVAGQKPLRGNDPQGTINVAGAQARVRFTTYDLARLATRIQLAQGAGLLPKADSRYLVNGIPTGWLDMAKAGGIDTTAWDAIYAASSNPATDANFVNAQSTDTAVTTNTGQLMWWNRASANAASLFNQPPAAGGNFVESVDIVILGQGRMIDVPQVVGAWMDFEPDDGIPGPAQVAHVQQCRAILHACGLLYMINPDQYTASGALSALTPAYASQILAAVDLMSLPSGCAAIEAAGSFSQFLNAQLAVLKGPNGDQAIPYGKLVLLSNMGGSGQELTAQQATDINAQRKALGMAGHHIFPQYANFATAGTSVPNQRKATILGITLPTG